MSGSWNKALYLTITIVTSGGGEGAVMKLSRKAVGQGHCPLGQYCGEAGGAGGCHFR